MELKSLGYIGVASTSLDDWRTFGPGFLGLQLVDRSKSSLAFRMDNREQRIMIKEGDRNGADVIGWEVEDATALRQLADRISRAGARVAYGSAALAQERFVRELIQFQDPAGNRVEVYYGPIDSDKMFVPGRAISGFRTGPLGMGHLVLTVADIEKVMPFYVDVLGFKLSDFALRPFRAYFFHLNARHHSLALIETGRNGVHHLMMELFSLDDVGQAYDLATGEEGRIGTTLGRHTNDFMTSFYAHTPAGFMMEYGWGGRDIDVDSWRPFEMKHGPSLWGHDRRWLSPEQQKEARDMRLRAASSGVRQPVQVVSGNYELLDGLCPWVE